MSAYGRKSYKASIETIEHYGVLQEANRRVLHLAGFNMTLLGGPLIDNKKTITKHRKLKAIWYYIKRIVAVLNENPKNIQDVFEVQFEQTEHFGYVYNTSNIPNPDRFEEMRQKQIRFKERLDKFQQDRINHFGSPVEPIRKLQ